MQTKRTVGFRAKAAELRATAEAYVTADLRTGILEIADSWEQLARRIEADGVVQPKGNPDHEGCLECEPPCGEDLA